MEIFDETFMVRALQLAQKGGRAVAPNPMVGAVIVKDGTIIGEGYHEQFGGPHAEVNAIASVKNKEDLEGATIYVTLEPCRHQGKTPPCLDLVESVGIKQVISGSMDPLHGREVDRADQGLHCTSHTSHRFFEGELAVKCQHLNRFFFTWATQKRPYITVKIATSADGFVTGKGGQMVHFTSPEQDCYVHELRAQHQAIMVGSNTVLADDSHLGVRHVMGGDPLRIVLDSKKRVPQTAQVFRDGNVMHVTTRQPFLELFKDLAKRGIASVLVEPGPTLYTLLKKENLVDELIILKGKKRLGEGLGIEF